MNLTLYGAAGGEVTGSAYLLATRQARVLIDAGLFQGGKALEARNRLPAGLRLDRLDAVLVTHAHLDHTGRLPLLVKNGYRGPVFATQATLELAGLILADSAKIQAQDAARANRKRERAGQPALAPLYDAAHVGEVVSLAQPAVLHQRIAVAPGVSARFVEAGHMLGSTSIEVTLEENGVREVVVFSGDLGPRTFPILREYEPLDGADVVVLESTYGDHDHRPYDETVAEFESIVRDAVQHRSKMLVPTFAVGRAQQMLYHLAVMFHERKVEPFPVFLDSPMAIEASRIYLRHLELMDEETLAWQRRGVFPLNPAWFKNSTSAEESKQLNDLDGPCLILAGAGMCTAGRIQHHFKQNLWKPGTHVLIVGYQGTGTLGRRLVEGADTIKLFGETIAVRARIHTLGGFSAHAGQSDLLQWFATLAPSKPRVLLTHGENEPRQTLASLIRERHGVAPTLPNLDEVVEL